MTKKLKNILGTGIIGASIVFGNILAEAKDKYCVPKNTKTLVGYVKKNGEKISDKDYGLTFISGKEYFRINYTDGYSKNKPNGKIDNQDRIIVVTSSISKEKIVDDDKVYNLATQCFDFEYFEDANLDGHGSGFSVFGYKPELKCNIPLKSASQETKKMNKLIDKINKILKEKKNKSAEKVYEIDCE